MDSFYTIAELELLGINFPNGKSNVLISKKASIYNAKNITIGNNVRIDDFCILSGKIVIGSNVHISAYTALFAGNEGIYLEDFTSISSRCVVYAISDDYSGEVLTNPTIPMEYRNIIGGKVVLKKHVLIGSGCTILPNVTIKEGVSVGSMSFINKSLESWGIYVGIPCKRIKERSKNLLNFEQKFINNEGKNKV